MISREITDGFGIAMGVDLLRWYVGVSYEQLTESARAFVFRLGPFYLHIIAS